MFCLIYTFTIYIIFYHITNLNGIYRNSIQINELNRNKRNNNNWFLPNPGVCKPRFRKCHLSRHVMLLSPHYRGSFSPFYYSQPCLSGSVTEGERSRLQHRSTRRLCAVVFGSSHDMMMSWPFPLRSLMI